MPLLSSWTLCYHTLTTQLRRLPQPCSSFRHMDPLEAQLHVCHSGCRAFLGMMSTSEPTFSSASAASERSSCFLINFPTSSFASLHEVHRDKSWDRARLITLVVLSQCQTEFDKFLYSMSGFQLALTVCNAATMNLARSSSLMPLWKVATARSASAA